MSKLLIFLAIVSVWNIANADELQQKKSVRDINASAKDDLQQPEILSAPNEVLSASAKRLSMRLKQLPDTPQQLLLINSNETRNNKYPSNCLEAAGINGETGIYTIQLDSQFMDHPVPFLVACDKYEMEGGWTVIQRRTDGSVNFYRQWAEYKLGFGNLEGEFWIGLDKLYALTTQTPQELVIIMEDFENGKRYARYASFAIGNEREGYALKVLGSYSGDAGDSLRTHEAMKFSTKDVDNDNSKDNCAVVYTGAWWYNDCHYSNLNGQYLRGEYEKAKFAQGVNWKTYRGYYYSLKYTQMMIRPKRF